MTAASIAAVAVSIVGGGTWLGVVLVKRDQTGLAVALFLIAALFAGTITDSLT